jgi:hypothetical protein
LADFQLCVKPVSADYFRTILQCSGENSICLLFWSWIAFESR